MRKLFRTIIVVAAMISAAVFTGCKKDEPTPSGSNGGNGGNDGPKAVAVTGVSLSKQTLSLVEGSTETLTATVTPSDATNKSISWKSSDAATATVDNNGKVTAVKAGSATITVTTTDGSKTATCSVTVTAKEVPPTEVSGVSIDPATLEIKEGETYQLKAKVTPADANQEVDWASPSPHIATIDQNGLLTAVAPGTVRIAVRSKAYNDKQGFCDVTVTQDKTLTGISLDADEITLSAGGSRTLTVIYYPEYASNKNVKWKSSDESVVTVSDGKVFGLKEGTATVTATSEEGSFTAECVVIVGKAEGPLIYSIGSDRSVYVNGELDPRSGIFNTDSFRLYTSEYIEAEGKDLITYEVYTNKSGDEPWICKNREPIISLAGHEGQTVYGLSCRNGVYAVLYINRDGEKKVVKAKSDGTVTEYELKGVAISMSSVTTTVAPSGDIYVSASIRDNFNQYYLAMYKLSDDGKVTEKLIEKNSIARPTIGVTDAGDVYILAGNYDEGMESVRLFKNGEFYKTIDQVAENLESSLRCVGNDVYTVIKDEVNKQVRVHKNGTKYQTLDYSQEVYLYYATGDQRPFWVNESGDVYLSLLENGSLYRIYKNGKNLYSTDNSGTVSFQPFCVIE